MRVCSFGDGNLPSLARPLSFSLSRLVCSLRRYPLRSCQRQMVWPLATTTIEWPMEASYLKSVRHFTHAACAIHTPLVESNRNISPHDRSVLSPCSRWTEQPAACRRRRRRCCCCCCYKLISGLENGNRHRFVSQPRLGGKMEREHKAAGAPISRRGSRVCVCVSREYKDSIG
jgi:hypothetical protein